MKQFDIVVINMSNYNEWQRGVSNRNYHVVHELLKNDSVGKILSVDYPPLTLKRAVRNCKDNFFSKLDNSTTIQRSFTDKLNKLSDRLYVYSNCDFFIKPERMVTQIRDITQKLDFDDFILWSYFPPVMPYIKNLGQKLTIFDAVDNWVEHSSYKRIKTRLQENYKVIKSDADVVFTVSEDLQSLFDNQPNVYWIPNGVDVTHYQDPHILINRDIADVPKPIIGYIGVVEERVDVDLIIYLAKKNPDKSYVVVGPVWNIEDIKTFKQHKNVHILGYKSYVEAPAYIQQFDVALIPHKQSQFNTSTNPMKLYEYLACGKPVVATKNSGAEQFIDHVYIGSSRSEIDKKVTEALEQDTEEKQEERKKAVQSHSWGSIVKQMVDIISNKLND